MPIYKKKGWWYAKIDKDGTRWTPTKVGMEESRWRTRKEAKLGEAELRQRVERVKTIQTNLDLLTLCNEYLRDMQAGKVVDNTFATKQRLCRELLERWGNVPTSDITVHMAHSYLLDRALSVSNHSFNAYKQEGRRLFNWAINQQLLPSDAKNPFAQVEKRRHDPKRPRPVPIEHVVRGYMAGTQMQKDLLLAYLITGARKSEILKWEWNDIDFKNRVYALHTRKSGTGETKTTQHEMPDLLYEVLMRRFEQRHPILPYVFWHRFYSRKHACWREDGFQSLSRFTERLCKRAGVPVFHLHQLRHLATSILKELGDMGLAKLQRFLRHDKQKTTEIYAGHLETGTKEQTDFLADFWKKVFDNQSETSTKTSTTKNKKGRLLS